MVTLRLSIALYMIHITTIQYVSSTLSDYIIDSMNNPHPEFVFTKLVQHRQTRDLYVGATNYIYKITPSMTIQITEEIGPKLDNPDCFPRRKCKLTLYNNYIKGMVIDGQTNRLILCSTLYHGACGKWFLSNLTKDGNPKRELIVSNNKTATTVVFLARGPVDGPVHSQNVMFVGASMTNTGIRVMRDMVPAISSRNLSNFSFTFVDFASGTFKKMDAIHRDSFPIWYIYGFSSNEFSYFATIQKPYTTADKYISKLVRVCNSDKRFYSYAEAELRCELSGEIYNLLQVAFIGKPGKLLAMSLGVTPQEDVLFGVFSRGNPYFNKSSRKNVLCIFPVRNIDKVFTSNTKKCFDGIGYTGPDHFVMPSQCLKTKNLNDNDCGQFEVNNPINGPDPIKSTATMTVNASSSSLLVTTIQDHTIAFIGTDDGHILKVRIESGEVAYQYADETVEQGQTIHKDMVLDVDKQSIYLMTDKMIYKMVLHKCSRFSDCTSCQSAKEPYCVWCLANKKCKFIADCDQEDISDNKDLSCSASRTSLSVLAVLTVIELILFPYML